MQVNTLYLGNFKPFSNLQTIQLAPITLIYGPNSAGKSSIIQSLLMGAEFARTGNRSLRPFLQDDYEIDLGNFKQVVHGQDAKRNIVLGWDVFKVGFNDDGVQELEWLGPDEDILLAIRFTGRTINTLHINFNERNVSKHFKESFQGLVRQEERFHKKCELDFEITFSESVFKKIIKQVFVSSVRCGSGCPPYLELQPLSEKQKPKLEEIILGKPEAIRRQMMIASANDFCSLIVQLWNHCADESSKQLGRISYFGPVRPRVRRGQFDVGMKLDSKQTNAIRSVNKWLSNPKLFKAPLKLQVIESKVPGSDKSVQQLKLFDVKRKVSVEFEDVGAGYGQIVAILRKFFNTDDAHPSEMILIEQPELHLHPALQAELGDVFVEAVLKDDAGYPRIVCETHSEHLLLRIMRRIKETSEGKRVQTKVTNADVAVLYVEPLEDRSVVRHMPLDSQGRLIRDWPGGFFEEGLREVLM